MFSQKQVLNRHIKSVHEKMKPFKFNDYDKTVTYKEHLNEHIE